MKQLKSKLFIPPVRAGLVSRPRLRVILDEGSHQKLTLVSAPAGFGKTTLLSEWIDESGRGDSTAWLSVDKRDNDPFQFWAYIVAAIQTVIGDFGIDILETLKSPQPPPIDTILIDLINEISKITRTVFLVIDDYHMITNQKVNDGIHTLVENLPHSFHIILLSRVDPAWPLAQYRAYGDFVEIRAGTLRFNLDEVTAFLNKCMGLGLTEADIRRLDNRTEGWIAGLQLAAISMKYQDKNQFINNFNASHRYILDFLVEEVLEQQTDEVRSFLMMTSILDRFNHSLCDLVTGRCDSRLLLDELERSNIFLFPLDEQRCWYRYHQLFQELLVSQLMIHYPDHILLLHQRASDWYDGEGDFDEAIMHAYAGKDYARVGNLVVKYGKDLLHNNKFSLLSEWIEKLPEEQVLNSPSLCIYKSWTRHWVGLREGGEIYLIQAVVVVKISAKSHPNGGWIREVIDPAQVPGYIATLRAHYATVKGDSKKAIDEANIALELLPPDDFFTRGSAAVALGAGLWGIGQVEEAEKAFHSSANNNLKGGFNVRACSSLCYAGMLQVKQARLLEAEKTFTEALNLGMGPGGRYLPISGYPMAKLAELACEWNDISRARQLIDVGIQLCDQLGHIDILAEALVALARVSLLEGNFPETFEVLERIYRISKKTDLDAWILTWMDDCRIRAWFLSGRMADALTWTEISGLTIDDELSYSNELAHINLARVLLNVGIQQTSEEKLSLARELLYRLYEYACQANWTQDCIKILLMLSQVHYLNAEEKIALSNITEALKLASKSRYLWTFVSEGRIINHLLRILNTNEVNKEYVDQLLSIFSHNKYEPDQQDLIEPLTSREIEVLNLLATSLSVPEIAEETFVSPHTIRSHVKNIYSKLGVHGRLAAVHRAQELNLIN
jgi:LuxR family maltose regulon positive regulatory protein